MTVRNGIGWLRLVDLSPFFTGSRGLAWTDNIYNYSQHNL